MGDAYSCKSLRRCSRGATVDADERRQEPAEVHDDPSNFGMGKNRISVAPGGEGGSWERTQHAPSVVSLLVYAFTSLE